MNDKLARTGFLTFNAGLGALYKSVRSNTAGFGALGPVNPQTLSASVHRTPVNALKVTTTKPPPSWAATSTERFLEPPQSKSEILNTHHM